MCKLFIIYKQPSKSYKITFVLIYFKSNKFKAHNFLKK